MTTAIVSQTTATPGTVALLDAEVQAYIQQSRAVQTVKANRADWAWIRQVHGVAQQGKAPIVTTDLQAMVAQVPESLLGLRDQALLLVGFAGAFRRSELVGVTVADLGWTADGLTVRLQRYRPGREGAYCGDSLRGSS